MLRAGRKREHSGENDESCCKSKKRNEGHMRRSTHASSRIYSMNHSICLFDLFLGYFPIFFLFMSEKMRMTPNRNHGIIRSRSFSAYILLKNGKRERTFALKRTLYKINLLCPMLYRRVCHERYNALEILISKVTFCRQQHLKATESTHNITFNHEIAGIYSVNCKNHNRHFF